MKIAKRITTVLLILILQSNSLITSAQEVTDVKMLADKNLGMLKEYITKEEEQKLYKLFDTKVKISDDDYFYQSLSEKFLAKCINNVLNDYTVKYLLDGEYYEYDLVEAEANNVLIKLQEVLSDSEYDTILDSIQEYEEGNDLAIESIGGILENNGLDTEVILSYLTQNSTQDLKALFEIHEGNTITYQPVKPITSMKLPEVENTHYQKVWDKIKNVLPNEHLKYFDEIYFATDGPQNELASVRVNDEIGKRWVMSIDPEDASVTSDLRLFYETIIHEYFHYISLNNTQVEYTFDYDSNNYREPGLVAKDSAYINQFYHQFWEDIIEDRDIDGENSYYYVRHQDEFVSEYASTSVAEDIAETFIFFIFEDAPTGNTLRDEKIKFFYQYEELVQLRDNIREKIM